MVGFYNYTVYTTYLGMLSAVAGILFAAEKNTFAALLCLILCGVVDGVDGTIARTKKDRTESEKRFGIEIDSLSDLVAFGVLPASIAFSLSGTVFARIASLFYALTALIRLSYFDVLAHEKLLAGEANGEYIGLPVTSCAWCVPACICLLPYIGAAGTVLLPAVLLVLGFSFIAPFHMRKPGKPFLVLGILLSLGLFLTVLLEHNAGLL